MPYICTELTLRRAVSNAKGNNRVTRSVISMSLGGTYSQATNDAVAGAVSAGIFAAVAAGSKAAPILDVSLGSHSTWVLSSEMSIDETISRPRD